MRYCLIFLIFLASCAGQPVENFYSLDLPKTGSGKFPVRVVMGSSSPGFETRKMAYVRRAHQIEYFSRNQWVAPPAKMLQSVMEEKLSGRGQDYRLDWNLLLFQQEFVGDKSRFHIALKAAVSDIRTNEVLAQKTVDISVDAAPDPYGGVIAANRAVEKLLDELSVLVPKR